MSNQQNDIFYEYQMEMELEKRQARLEEAKSLFDKALKIAYEACEVAEKELKKPLTTLNPDQIESIREGRGI